MTDSAPDLTDIEPPRTEGEFTVFTHRHEEYALRMTSENVWEVGQQSGDGGWTTVFEFSQRGESYGVDDPAVGWRSQGTDWRRVIRDMI